MRLDTEIWTSRGVCKCVLQRVSYAGLPAISADLWRGCKFLESEITEFSAGVYLKWNGRGYKIIRRVKTDYTNDYWLELEQSISNLIVVNE